MAEDIMRPSCFDEYRGQDALKRELRIRIRSAMTEPVRPLDHVLLDAPPGSGKTSIARLIAAELGGEVMELVMPVEKKALHSAIKQADSVLILDEIHMLPQKTLQVWLQTLIESNYVMDTAGRITKTPWLCVIGCTTKREDIIAPLYERFPIKPAWVPYTDEETTEIIRGMGRKIGIELDPEIAHAFGQGSLGLRAARRLVLAYRDLLEGTDTVPTAQDAFDLCHVESDGLTAHHVRYLQVLDALGGIKGLKVIASLLQLNEAVVTSLERVLYLRGYLTLTDSGREITKKGYARARANSKEQP